MTDRHLDEGAITSARIIALRADPVQGHYDSAHLKEIHRRIFEPLFHHHPGEFRPDSSAHRKTRELEGQSMRYVVDYAGGDLQHRVDTILEGVQAGVALKGLSQDEFSQRISQLYADLDHAHPFREGNSRTLREFTHQLAQNAGYELEWSSTNADAEARNRLYVARDVAVYERHYPGLSDQFLRENSRHPQFADMHHANHMLKVFQDHDRLYTIIRENLSPIGVPQFNLQTSLDVRADAFAEQAAQRLMEVVQSHDLSPAQIREWVADMGREAQRQLNLEVITGARLSRDTLEAKQGDSEGFTRMFQEASDPASCKLLKQAADNLQQRGIDPDRLYLTVARPGETHEGRLEFKTTRVGVVSNDQGQHLATPAASLKGVAISDEGRVQFTAREPAKVQRQMDY